MRPPGCAGDSARIAYGSLFAQALPHQALYFLPVNVTTNK
jgi:hypothetical protein